ncbi:MAG TPA: polysaccharide deacetylase family protein, partial [Capsulimonadaceae bacterium]|nr:polysaccharide deacetylase family protein [Capsulimonadaceae bacterium]
MSQIEQGLPILDSHGFRATFYVNPHSARSRSEDWRRALATGHEIGNHTVTHPCSVNFDFVGKHNLED